MIQKPDIARVIEDRGIQLKRCGKELIGLCPFHAEKTPSFYVNPDKQVFLCRGCGASGDVFDFIMRLDGCTFAEAAKSLGVSTDKPTPRRGPSAEAVAITDWANAQFLRAQAILREINQKFRLAKELSWKEEIDRLVREFQILSILSDDLQTPRYAILMHRDPEQKSWVENLLADAPPVEPPEPFPALTTGYMAHLKEVIN